MTDINFPAIRALFAVCLLLFFWIATPLAIWQIIDPANLAWFVAALGATSLVVSLVIGSD